MRADLIHFTHAAWRLVDTMSFGLVIEVRIEDNVWDAYGLETIGL